MDGVAQTPEGPEHRLRTANSIFQPENKVKPAMMSQNKEKCQNFNKDFRFLNVQKSWLVYSAIKWENYEPHEHHQKELLIYFSQSNKFL